MQTAVIWENEELGAKFKVWPLAEAPIPDELKKLAKETRDQVVELAVEQVCGTLDSAGVDILFENLCSLNTPLIFNLITINSHSSAQNLVSSPPFSHLYHVSTSTQDEEALMDYLDGKEPSIDKLKEVR